MDSTSAARGGWHLPSRLLALCVVWACIGFVALSSPLRAGAAAYTEPKEPFTNPSYGVASPLCEDVNGYPSVETLTKYEVNYMLYWVLRGMQYHCETGHLDQERLSKRLWWITAELLHVEEKQDSLKTEVLKALGKEGTLHTDLAQLHTDLTVKGGLAVALASLPELTAGTKTIGTVEVSKAPPDTYVQSAVLQDSETLNQGLWGLAGLFTGGLLLYVFYKVVRP